MNIIIALDNVRSAYNVGTIARTADGLGISSVVTIGITPHPRQVHDARLPHVIEKAEHALRKTALGAETLISQHFDTSQGFLAAFKDSSIIALEQVRTRSINLAEFHPNEELKEVVLVVGNELSGVSAELLDAATVCLEIPMRGKKESLNVSAAMAIAAYELTKSRT